MIIHPNCKKKKKKKIKTQNVISSTKIDSNIQTFVVRRVKTI